MTIKNVTIGDQFTMGGKSKNIYEVVDFYEVKSLSTGDLVRHEIIAKGVNTLATNRFETAFATVVRGRIK